MSVFLVVGPKCTLVASHAAPGESSSSSSSTTTSSVNSPRESEGVCFYRRWFVCLSVTTITKKIVDGFVSNFMRMFLGGKWKTKFVFRYDR